MVSNIWKNNSHFQINNAMFKKNLISDLRKIKKDRLVRIVKNKTPVNTEVSFLIFIIRAKYGTRTHDPRYHKPML